MATQTGRSSRVELGLKHGAVVVVASKRDLTSLATNLFALDDRANSYKTAICLGCILAPFTVHSKTWADAALIEVGAPERKFVKAVTVVGNLS